MAKPILYLFNGKVAKFGNSVLGTYPTDPVNPNCNPLNLPPFTLRFRANSDSRPVVWYGTLTLVEGRIWDFTYENTNWNYVLSNMGSLYEILSFNSTGITSMKDCFNGDASLINVPLFDTRTLTDVSNMFIWCDKVESGIVDLYNQMANQVNPPEAHSGCFKYCGSSTVTGAAELAQIPSDWKS